MARPKKYPDELVARGVRLALESERPIAHIAADLGMHPETLRKKVHLAEARPAEEVQSAERVFAWAERHDPPITVRYGTGTTTAAAMFGRDDAGAYLYPFYLYNSGSIEIQFGLMASGVYPAFQPLEARQKLLDRLTQIPDFKIDTRRIDKRPNIPLAAITGETAFNQFIKTVEWALQQAQAYGR
jgi:transposase-like protein